MREEASVVDVQPAAFPSDAHPDFIGVLQSICTHPIGDLGYREGESLCGKLDYSNGKASHTHLLACRAPSPLHFVFSHSW